MTGLSDDAGVTRPIGLEDIYRVELPAPFPINDSMRRAGGFYYADRTKPPTNLDGGDGSPIGRFIDLRTAAGTSRITTQLSKAGPSVQVNAARLIALRVANMLRAYIDAPTLKFTVVHKAKVEVGGETLTLGVNDPLADAPMMRVEFKAYSL